MNYYALLGFIVLVCTVVCSFIYSRIDQRVIRKNLKELCDVLHETLKLTKDLEDRIVALENEVEELRNENR